MQILLVEDDNSIATGIGKALRHEGFTVNHVSCGRDVLHVVETAAPDIIVLDLGLPDMDGIEVLKSVRNKGLRIPVLILTARSSVEALVIGLDQGADDYLPKPFEIPELIARLRVIERRLSNMPVSEIKVGRVGIDIASHEAFLDDQLIQLPRREFAVLKSLMENAGKIQTRESLESRLYAWGEEISSNAIEVHIHHLRKKLGSEFIKTVRGVGYTISKS